MLLDRDGGDIRAPVMTIRDVEQASFGNDPLVEAFVAEDDDGVPLGLVSFYRGYSGWHAKPVAVVHLLYVAEQARGSDLGRQLMAAVAALVLERGWVRIELCVEEGRPAVRFYETIGMTDRRERRFGIEGDQLVRLAETRGI